VNCPTANALLIEQCDYVALAIVVAEVTAAECDAAVEQEPPGAVVKHGLAGGLRAKAASLTADRRAQ
jgi:hypothetical protein